jgi:hypothetical protein
MSLLREGEIMNQSDAEASGLANQATTLFNRSSALSKEAAKKYDEAKVAFKKFGSSKDIKMRNEGNKLIDDGDRLTAEAKSLREEGHKLLEQSKELKLHADVSEPSPNYVTCCCQHCDTGIEFDAAELAEENSIVPCPHCGLETKLFIPQTATSQDSTLPILNDNELEAFVDGFTTEKDFLTKRDIYNVETRKKLSAIWNKRHPLPTETELNALMDGLTLDENMQVLKITDWDEKMAFLQQLQKTKGRKMKIVSINSELELADDNIIIRRSGVAHAMAAGLTGERMIPISTLTAIQLKLGVWWSPGFILFSYAGSKPFMGGIIEATQDPDAFIFQKELNDDVSAFKAKVEKILRDSKQQTRSTPNPSGTLTDELGKLAELKQQGVLSQEEFDAAKKKLLA